MTLARKQEGIIRGKRLSYNASQQDKYKKAICALINKMTSETEKRVTKLFEDKTAEEFFEQQEKLSMDANISSQSQKVMNELNAKFQALFDKKAKPLSESMVDGASLVSSVNVKNSLKQIAKQFSLKGSPIRKGREEISKAVINENVELIKSIPKEYFKKVQGLVMRSITTGNGLEDLIPQLRKYKGQTDRSAKNTALDQTRKAYNSLNKQNLMIDGIKKFEWVHSGGGQKPRKSHIAMNGKIYSFKKPPVINKDNPKEAPVRGIPGQAINCGCTMIPVVEYEKEDLE